MTNSAASASVPAKSTCVLSPPLTGCGENHPGAHQTVRILFCIFRGGNASVRCDDTELIVGIRRQFSPFSLTLSASCSSAGSPPSKLSVIRVSGVRSYDMCDCTLHLGNQRPQKRRRQTATSGVPARTLFNRVSTTRSALNRESLVFLTSNYPHCQLIDTQLAKSGISCKRAQAVNPLDTQIGLFEAGEGIAIIPSFGLPACRSRKVTMSELVEPVVTLEFDQISHRGRRLPEAASEFSAFLKKYIATWAGAAGIL
jgi:LysR substrate binding domain